MWRVGIDVGGTFTDLFALHQQTGEQRTGKVLTTRPDRSLGVIEALRDAQIAVDQVSFLIHGTTTATNALIERNYPQAAFVTTDGFRDTIEIGRQHRKHLYDPYQSKPSPIIARRHRFAVSERMDAKGNIVRPLDEARVAQIAGEINASGLKAAGIGFINSYANPAHELRAAQILRELCPGVRVITSYETAPVFREHGRFVTTAIRTVLMPVMEEYFDNLELRLEQEKFTGKTLILKSSGGVMTLDLARSHPEQQLESGPAGGVAYARYLAKACGFDRILHSDVGGTSFDVSMVEFGQGTITRSHELQWEVPVIVPMLDIHSVGAGGGSIGWIDPGGSMRVGPKSAGSLPGPACYGRGGTEPTITDANLVLGRLDSTLRGKFELDVAAAERAIKTIADQVGLTVIEAAEGMVNIGSEYMAQAVKKMLVSRGRDPRDFVYAAFGGAGALHACFVAKAINIPQVIVPPNAGVASACGATVMDFRQDLERFYYSAVEDCQLDRINSIFAELEEQGIKLLTEQGVDDPSLIKLTRTAQMRYVGQSYEVETQIPSKLIAEEDLPEIIEAFHSAHKAEFGVSSTEFKPAIISLSVAAIGEVKLDQPIRLEQASDRPAENGERQVYVDGAWVTARVYDGEALAVGTKISGPAIIDYDHAAGILPAWANAEVIESGALLINIIQTRG